VVCVPHYLGQVAHGSLSSFVRWTTIRNVRLNADRSLRRDRLPSFPSVPRAGVRFLQGLVNASVRSDGVSCFGMLDALRRQVVQGLSFGGGVFLVGATGR
jgi:hypothetical protein